ncbi:C4b-binding protein alpha chain [Bombina bombina]|uniref:C4b-binding protein alpha chain n=1 Tax=Bombina bombina TaxID=8345 RepID=UPI00235B05ED|nr:C4b-binding protein alpha chain [Bombina bombina]
MLLQSIRCHFVLLSISVLITGIYGECGPPPRLTEAELRAEYSNENLFTENATIKYDCRPGFVRIPGQNRVLTCLKNFTWSTPDEFCTRRRCPSLSEIENGYFEAKDFLFGSRATYYCNEGYRMLSSRTYRDCTADGTWSNADPVCEVVICSPPDSIPDGAYNPVKDEYFYLDSVVYSCSKNLALVGASTISCGSEGTWSPDIPICKVVSCPSPNIPNADRMSGFVGPYILNSGVSFKCKVGFYINGSSISTCNIDSHWEPPLPECLPVTCTLPESISNGTYTPVKGIYYYMDSVRYSCGKDLELIGSKSIHCLLEGTWSSKAPICKVVRCPDPNVTNSEMWPRRDGRYRLNSIVYLRCKDGFNMNGSSKTTCQLDSKWSPPLPECLPVTCLRPTSILNGSYTPVKDRYNYKDTVTYNCINDLTLVGKNIVSCDKTGSWNSSAPICKVVTCQEPEVANSEKVSGVCGTYIANSDVTFKCKSGFTMKGFSYSKCSTAGQWEPPLPKCIMVTCPKPEVANSETVEGFCGTYIMNSRATFKCKSGFTMKGSIFSTCSTDGQWEPPLPECLLSSSIPSTVELTMAATLSNPGTECDKIKAMTEATRKCGAAPEDWKNYLEAEYLYLQIENLKLDIERKKKKLAEGIHD